MERVFEAPRYVRWMWWLLLASPVLAPFWVLLINALLGQPLFPPLLLISVVPLLFFTVVLVQAPPILQSIMRATVTEDDLEVESLLGRRRRLRWSEISALQDFTYRGRQGSLRVLNVFDADGRRAFRLTGRLRGFDALADLVQARAPLAERTAPSWWEQFIAYA